MKGEKLVEGFIDAVVERNSYLPQEGQEQTPARNAQLAIAKTQVKLAYSKLNGALLGEARRRLAARGIPNNV